MEFSDNPQLELAYEFVQFTNQNVFLTGKAGTGKTTFLRNLRNCCHKRMIVVAPTGVAAINAGGVTIHSFFQISFGPQIPGWNLKGISLAGENRSEKSPVKRFSREKISIIRSLDLLVIDEISMVRADLLDAIDEVLRRFRNRTLPFGGVQLLMIGDLQQLAPVTKEEEWEVLKNHYETSFFFSSRALLRSSFKCIELKQIYRQSDLRFIDLLNKVRTNQADAETIRLLNNRYRAGFHPPDEEGYITLTSHNWQAKNINCIKLSELPAKSKHFTAIVSGEFPEMSYPTDFELELRKGAQVMFVKNDPSPEKLFFNGKIGYIAGMDDNGILVNCTGEEEPIDVKPAEWKNVRYKINETTRELTEEEIGCFSQYPLKLAWAITIHKSQGLTFDRVIIDARSSFAHGQVYVALSRCRTLEGVVLSTPLTSFSIKNDDRVLDFSRSIDKNSPCLADLEVAKINYIRYLLNDLFDFSYLASLLRQSLKISREYAEQMAGNVQERIEIIEKFLSSEIVPVAEKFKDQIRILTEYTPLTDALPALKERLKKASVWFLEKTGTGIMQPFSEISFETDNKAVRTSVMEVLERVNETLHVKCECLAACRSDFSPEDFVKVKSRAILDKIRLPASGSRQSSTVSQNLKHPVLYRILSEWRLSKARERNIAPSNVVSLKALQHLAGQLPVTTTMLKGIHGIGKKKIQLHGNEIIRIISTYCIENEIDFPDDPDSGHAVATPENDSKSISYKMFLEGKSLNRIAMERKLSLSTVEGHLVHFAALGMIKSGQLVSPEKAGKIIDYLTNHEHALLKDAKAALGNDISYGEIKLVQAMMRGNERSPDC